MNKIKRSLGRNHPTVANITTLINIIAFVGTMVTIWKMRGSELIFNGVLILFPVVILFNLVLSSSALKWEKELSGSSAKDPEAEELESKNPE